MKDHDPKREEIHSIDQPELEDLYKDLAGHLILSGYYGVYTDEPQPEGVFPRVFEMKIDNSLFLESLEEADDDILLDATVKYVEPHQIDQAPYDQRVSGVYIQVRSYMVDAYNEEWLINKNYSLTVDERSPGTYSGQYDVEIVGHHDKSGSFTPVEELDEDTRHLHGLAQRMNVTRELLPEDTKIIRQFLLYLR